MYVQIVLENDKVSVAYSSSLMFPLSVITASNYWWRQSVIAIVVIDWRLTKKKKYKIPDSTRMVMMRSARVLVPDFAMREPIVRRYSLQWSNLDMKHCGGGRSSAYQVL